LARLVASLVAVVCLAGLAGAAAVQDTRARTIERIAARIIE
jgi:hypothetical protein